MAKFKSAHVPLVFDISAADQIPNLFFPTFCSFRCKLNHKFCVKCEWYFRFTGKCAELNGF